MAFDWTNVGDLLVTTADTVYVRDSPDLSHKATELQVKRQDFFLVIGVHLVRNDSTPRLKILCVRTLKVLGWIYPSWFNFEIVERLK